MSDIFRGERRPIIDLNNPPALPVDSPISEQNIEPYRSGSQQHTGEFLINEYPDVNPKVEKAWSEVLEQYPFLEEKKYGEKSVKRVIRWALLTDPNSQKKQFEAIYSYPEKTLRNVIETGRKGGHYGDKELEKFYRDKKNKYEEICKILLDTLYPEFELYYRLFEYNIEQIKSDEELRAEVSRAIIKVFIEMVIDNSNDLTEEKIAKLRSFSPLISGLNFDNNYFSFLPHHRFEFEIDEEANKLFNETLVKCKDIIANQLSHLFCDSHQAYIKREVSRWEEINKNRQEGR